MTRIRTVKPELFRHEALFEAEKAFQLPLRLAFIGLFTCCDRAGRFRWRPRQLMLDILPYDGINVADILNALASHGFIVKYEQDGQCYGCIPSWEKHQRVNHKEKDSDYPALAQCTAIDVTLSNQDDKCISTESPVKHALATGDSRVSHACATRGAPVVGTTRAFPGGRGIGREGEKEGKGNGKGKGTGIGMEIIVASEPRPVVDNSPPVIALTDPDRLTAKHRDHPSVHADNIAHVFTHWQTTMHHLQACLDNKRKALIGKALKSGYSVMQLCHAIEGCSVTPHNMGDNDRGQRYDGLHIILRDGDQIDR